MIAETVETPTPFRKIVVTNDDGRFVIPEVPADVAFQVWLRGYGIEDSEKYWARSEHEVGFEIAESSSPVAAAQILPANYWLSMLNLPDPGDFPGTGSNGIGTQLETQGDWVDGVKDRYQLCHQMGHAFTRVFPASANYPSTRAGWNARVRLGEEVNNQMNAMGREVALDVFTDWTDRINAGEVPPPPRPADYPEQNVVISQWTWVDPGVFVHDNSATDKRQPGQVTIPQRSGVWRLAIACQDACDRSRIESDRRSRHGEPRVQWECLQHPQSHARRKRDLVDDLLDSSKLEPKLVFRPRIGA